MNVKPNRKQKKKIYRLLAARNAAAVYPDPFLTYAAAAAAANGTAERYQLPVSLKFFFL